LAALVFSPVFTPLFHSKVSTSNDQGASGYMIILVVLIHLVFLGLAFFAGLSIARHGGMDWISSSPLLRTGLFSIGLIAMVIISAISVMSRFANASSPALLELLMKMAPTVIFILVVGMGFILNNDALRTSIPAALYKIPLTLVSILCLSGLLYAGVTLAFSKSPGLEDSTRQYENAPAIQASRISEIEQADITQEFVRVLSLTGGIYPMEVRQKAMAKIKTHPDYQNELVSLLNSDSPMDALSFLSIGEVDDKAIFPEAINTGILNTAAWIRHTIQGTGPSGYYADQYTAEVSSALQAADKYAGMGKDFLQAVKELRSALDEPFAGKEAKFDCIAGLEEWIKKHS
jgi:hypothetical protein